MIAIAVDSLERYRFMLRLVGNVRDEFDFIFLTSEPLAHILLVMAGFKSVYIHRSYLSTTKCDQVNMSDDVGMSIEVLNEQIGWQRAVSDYQAIYSNVKSILTKFNITKCVMWNGQQLLCRAISRVCQDAKISTLFFEISNLPRKLFVDSSGVNALSYICKNRNAIDQYAAPPEEFHEAWLQEYEKYKSNPLPQSKTRFSNKIFSLVNYALKLPTLGVGRIALRSIRIKNSLANPSASLKLSDVELINSNYIFLPLQVSGDTQIKLHSSVNNVGAIHQAYALSSIEKCELFVKLHPAENDSGQIAEVLQLQHELKFKLVSSNTTQLIKHAKKIVTINSTVGLEGLLYGKEVVSLGRCFYKDFDKNRLMKYIHSFLVSDIDYFGNGAISHQAARNVLTRD